MSGLAAQRLSKPSGVPDEQTEAEVEKPSEVASHPAKRPNSKEEVTE